MCIKSCWKCEYCTNFQICSFCIKIKTTKINLIKFYETINFLELKNIFEAIIFYSKIVQFTFHLLNLTSAQVESEHRLFNQHGSFCVKLILNLNCRVIVYASAKLLTGESSNFSLLLTVFFLFKSQKWIQTMPVSFLIYLGCTSCTFLLI